MYDIMDVYRESNVLLFKDIHKGPGFIAGSGASLRHVPRNLSEKYPVICVNGSILWFTGNPYYFTCDGRIVFKQHWARVRSSESHVFANLDSAGEAIHLHGGIEDYSRLTYFKRENTCIFKKDTDSLILGSSSAHVAAHLGYIMGFDPIILLGIDCSYEEGKKYYNDFEGCPSDNYTKDFLFNVENIKPNKDNSSDVSLETFKKTWMDIKEMNPSVDIINASGGNLDVFPRVDIERFK